MELILDTNALSAVADGDLGLQPLLREANAVSLPVIVLGEYRYGIRQSRYRARYEEWLAEAILNFTVLDIDSATAEYYADVRQELKRKGRPLPSNDLWIAALTRQHALPLLSRDQHFDLVPRLTRLSW